MAAAAVRGAPRLEERRKAEDMWRGSTGMVLTAMGCALSVACTDQEAGPTAYSDGRSIGPAGPIVSVAGPWEWTSEHRLTMPPLVALMFGIPVEGEVTHLRCESSGTMFLSQDGASFSGQVIRANIDCETRGGFVVDELPPDFAPPVFALEDGRIRGLSIHFLFGGSPLPTPSHGNVADVEGVIAQVLEATGRTIVPGDPRSPLPMVPPPAGTSKMIAWQATRP